MIERYVILSADGEREMTPEEIAERQAEEALPSSQDPQTVIRSAYLELPAELQDKYESLLIAGAFHLERGNLSAVARKLTQAEVEMDSNNPDEVGFFQTVQQALNLEVT